MQKVDVAIVGGGMVGLTLATALSGNGLNIAVISNVPLEQPVPESPLLRVSAINEANREALRALGVWQHLPTDRIAAYGHMHVWDKDSFGHIHFDHEQMQRPQLGHIVENQVLTNALATRVTGQDDTVVINSAINKVLWGEHETMLMLDNDDVLSCKLLVGADGANSFVRKQAGLPISFRDYGHTAIVATVKTSESHDQTARQVFTPHGPLALLPLSDPHLCSIVWSQHTEQAELLMQLSEEDFSHALTAATNSEAGVITLDSERQSFTLTMRYARQWVREGAVIIGDAAHTIHPLAGQGANLGMQDALSLARVLKQLHQENKSLSRLRYLRPFERERKAETMKMISAMDGFKMLFEGDNPVKKMIRGVGLMTTDHLPAVKRKLISQAMGF
ncbi:FAD-dependent 2-octaprenylphenol hydroxylase [Salinimonas chungwhensis]|uniref:FAD-dependent 2-octaprenylphenol hydroxylase n=1 Tax=Salinimonas chungwhensis TaxID=265425 RepID=UPI000365EFEF|nr:FAD-dependent 2-octaprenylphenol hydroxylase [Salinimonas chungwhensis]